MSGWEGDGVGQRRAARRSAGRRSVNVIIAAAFVVAGCSGGGETNPSATVSATAPTTAPSPAPAPAPAPASASDEILRIGVLLPRSGLGAAFGAPLLSGVDLAKDEINLVGGVNGRAIVVQVEDESSDPAAGLQQLIDSGADVIVGPASSNVASSILGAAVDAGLPVCSPAATSLSLSSYPDDNLFFRTMPSEALQVRALASRIEATGLRSATALVPDDEFGRRYIQALQNELRATGVTLTSSIQYSPSDETLGPPAARAVAANPPVLVVIGDLANGSRMLAALSAAAVELPPIFVNEALRSHDTLDALGTEPRALAKQISGVGPSSQPDDTAAGARFIERFTAQQRSSSIDFAAYAYDCVIAFALAAESVQSDDPRSIAASTPAVTRAGQLCIGFAECRELLLAGRNIDYDGASGPLELSASGDVMVANLDVFGFDDFGEEVVLESLRAG